MLVMGLATIKSIFMRAIIVNLILIIALVACGNTPISKTVFFTPVPISTIAPTPTIVPAFIYYSQRDPLWANIVLTCNNGRKSTFTHQGCGETSFAMLMSTFVNPKYTPDQVLSDFYGYGFCAGTDSSYSASLLHQQGFTVEGVYTDASKVKEDIRNGWLAWIHVEYHENGRHVAHEVLITGIDENNNFILADSYYGIGSIDENKFPYGESNITGFYIIKPPIK
jgi:hypothetical protein